MSSEFWYVLTTIVSLGLMFYSGYLFGRKWESDRRLQYYREHAHNSAWEDQPHEHIKIIRSNHERGTN